jgi:hypothetical protein
MAVWARIGAPRLPVQFEVCVPSERNRSCFTTLGAGVETGAVGNDPIPAIRVKPGEFFLAAETVRRAAVRC